MPVGPADLTLPSPLRTAAPSPGWWIFRLLLSILPASIAMPPSTAPPMAGPNTLLPRANAISNPSIVAILEEHTPTLNVPRACRSEEHKSELQSLMRISYAVFCLNTNTKHTLHNHH